MNDRSASREKWLVQIPGILLLILASQIYISLFSGGFLISVAVALLPVLVFLWPDFALLPSTLLAAVGIFLLRMLVQPTAGGFWANCRSHAPEVLFYLIYGILLYFYLRRYPLRPVKLVKFIPLAGIDIISNEAELLVRTGVDALEPMSFLQLFIIGVVRTFLIWLILRTLDAYSVQVLRREEAERYKRLLVMTATLKSEVAWMTKGTALIEDTMHTAYGLYSRLRDSGADSQQVEVALSVAKDIHEVKKEYFQIVRGITEALDSDGDSDQMEMTELFRILGESTRRTAEAVKRNVAFSSSCKDRLSIRQYHYLMSIFRNLLNNAVEAAPEKRRVHLNLTERSEGDQLVFQVTDDCGGIPQQQLPQIFLPGYSSKINYTTGEVNRGLGLTIVKDLVEDRLHGAITVQSANGCTAFTVRIPRRELIAEEG